MTERQEHWKVDKKIPLALVMAILVQTGAGLWWASSINTRVATVEVHNSQTDTTIAKIESVNATTDVRTARLEEKYSAIDDVLKRMDDKLDKLIDEKRNGH